MIWASLVVRGLAAWRLADMLVNEDGPNRVFFRLREASGIRHDGQGNISHWMNEWTPLHCVYCTNVWTAFLLARAPKLLVFVLSLSAVASLIELSRPKDR